MSGLRDKVVIVTGASSGIGAQTAVEFARLGCRMVLTARRTDRLQETADACVRAGLDQKKIHVVPGDVMKDADLRQIVESTKERFGDIHVLINNAGVAVKADTMSCTVDDMDKMYQMHIRAVFILTQLALPHIIRNKGSIVNVSSIASNTALSYVMPYAVAKCGQDHMMKAMSLDLAPKGVRINSICPGSILTEIFSASGYNDNKSLKQVLSDQAYIHPLKRLGQPLEAARAIVFLASDDASFITGVALPVDGGRANTTALPPPKL